MTSQNLLQVGMHWLPEGAGGGADRYFRGLVEALRRINVPLRPIIFGEAQASEKGELPPECVGPRDLGAFERLRRVREAGRQSLAEKPGNTLIATHFALYALPLLDFYNRNPHVVHFHGPWSEESAAEGESKIAVFAKRQIERAVYRSARSFVVLSEAFKQILVERYAVPSEKIHVIPGGIDSKAFAVNLERSAARERLGWPQDRRIILCVRRLARRMGLEELIGAMKTIRTEFPDTLLLIAGKGVLAESLAARIRDEGLSGHVKLLGFVPEADLPLAYRAADVSVVPSQSLEGFGLVTLESLAAGTPVLVTPIGGLPEAVSGLSPDLVLPGAGCAAMTDGLLRFLRGDLQLPSAEACQAYVRNGFDWDVIGPRVLKVYNLTAWESGGDAKR